MRIETAAALMFRVQEDPSALALHHHFQKFYMANRDTVPSDEQYEAATRYVSKLTAIKFTQANVVAILGLYPQARILLAVMGPDESAVHEALQFAVAHFLLSCRWPAADEGLDVHEFTSLLRRRAVEMGLNTLQGMNEFTEPAATVESVVDDSFNVEPRHEVEPGDQAREFGLFIPPKQPSLLSRLVGKVREMVQKKHFSKLVSKARAKLAEKSAAKVASKVASKQITDRLDPSV
ncbi:hypothetical protein [Pseudomonas serbica]|uniref:hypothetical protein n=1 Tax=Pseudomonas serbica TaxID=2965074 RepID=UPI00237ADB9B|nr:hypothetical protein [Pseudomonas serbica]